MWRSYLGSFPINKCSNFQRETLFKPLTQIINLFLSMRIDPNMLAPVFCWCPEDCCWVGDCVCSLLVPWSWAAMLLLTMLFNIVLQYNTAGIVHPCSLDIFLFSQELKIYEIVFLKSVAWKLLWKKSEMNKSFVCLYSLPWYRTIWLYPLF